MAVNLRGTFIAARAALVPMKAQGYGRMLFTSSITGPHVTSPGHGHYSATKAGINGFIRAAALEFAGYGITVNGVEPGNILTEAIQLHRGAAFIKNMEDADPARPPRQPARRRQRLPVPGLRRCRATSPARPSSSTAARCCPKATISGCCRAEQRATWGGDVQSGTANLGRDGLPGGGKAATGSA